MTQETSALMQEAIDYAARHAGELRVLCHRLTGDLQTGAGQDTLARLQGLLQGIGCVSQALQLTKPLQQSRGIEPSLEAMPNALQPLVNALENRDWALAGDVLAYELEPVLARWSQELTQLSSEATPDAGD